MDRIVVDGIFLTEQINGIQRYGNEIIRAMDALMGDMDKPPEIEIAVPEAYAGSACLKNIPVVRTGKNKGKLWEQTDLVRYLKKRKAGVICFENLVPILCRRGIVVIHDISFRANPEFFNATSRGMMSMLWRRLNYKAACSSGMNIITDSGFSKKEILKYYRASPERISIAGCGWQHVDEMSSDDSIFERYPMIEKGKYYFAMATLSKWKNFKWVVNAARANPDESFVIAGGGDIGKFIKDNGAEGLNNIVLTGYISDSQAKSLMSECRAFLFPTLYEGFGLPPLEAAAAGAKAIAVSDIEVMHEIYGSAASYIDPHDTEPDLRKIAELTDDERSRLLSEYSWERSAQTILDAAKEM